MSQQQSSRPLRNFPRPLLNDLQRVSEQLLIQFHYYELPETTAVMAQLIKTLKQEVSDEYDDIN